MMSIKKYKLVHQTPDHFVLHDGQAHFHVAKKGLDKELVGRIQDLKSDKELQNYEDGGKVEGNPDAKGNYTTTPSQNPEDNEKKSATEQGQESLNKALGFDQGGPVGPGGVPLDPAKVAQFHPFDDGGSVPPPPPDSDWARAFKKGGNFADGGKVKHDSANIDHLKETFDKFMSEEAHEHYASGGHVLNANARKHIKEKNFALPGRRYPIEDVIHARNALARVSQHGSSEEKATVRRKVHAKYPSIEQKHMAHGGVVDHNNKVDGTEDLNTVKEHQFLREWINKHVSPKQNFDEGGQVPNPDNDKTQDDSMKEMGDQAASYKKLLDDFKQFQKSNMQPQGQVQHYAGESGDPQDSVVDDSSPAPDEGGASTQDPNMSPADTAFPASAQAATPAPTENIPPPAGEQPSPSDQVPSNPEDIQSLTQNAVNEAASQVPQQEVPKGKPSLQDQLQTLATSYSNLAKDRAKSDAEFSKNLAANPINATHYMDNLGTAQKISTGVGLILGGIFSGVTGQANPALKMLDQAINNDIEAQRLNQSNKQNLWKMNHEAFGDQMSANLATRNNMLDIAKYQVDQLMGNAPGPMAQARADALKTQIDAEKSNNNNTIAMNQMRQKILSGQSLAQEGHLQQDPETLVPFLIPNAETQKTALKEIQDAKNITQNGPKMLASFDQAVKDKSLGRLKINPSSVNALHQLMLPLFQEVDGTVRQGPMEESFKNVTPQLLDSPQKMATRRQSLTDWINSKSAAPTTRAYGIDLSKYQSTHNAVLPANINQKVQIFMRQNPDIKTPDQAVQILKQHGKL